MKKLFLVLGMHRSSTSLTTGLLSSYGIYVGPSEDLWAADVNNQQGYFENKYVVLLNDKILYEHGLHWAMLPKHNNIIKDTQYKNEIDNIISNIIKKSQKEQDILIKDPRMCLLELIWREEFIKFSLDENIIFIFRHPFEVAQSLLIRDNINFSYALKLWFYYNFSILNLIHNNNIPVLAIRYEDYFTSKEKQLEKLEKFIDYKEKTNDTEKIINITLRHNSVQNLKQSLNTELEYMVLELYTFMSTLANNNKNIITEKHLEKYKMYLEKMSYTSYEENNQDIFPKSIKKSIGREKKLWCIYQLQNKKIILVKKFKDYFCKNKITKLFLYGNGTLTEVLIPILHETNIIIEKIFDIKHKENLSILQNVNKESYILNTVVNYGDSINNYLIKYFKENYIIDIYILLNKFLAL